MTTEREEQLLRDAYAAGITQQRELANAIKRARFLALLPYVIND